MLYLFISFSILILFFFITKEEESSFHEKRGLIISKKVVKKIDKKNNILHPYYIKISDGERTYIHSFNSFDVFCKFEISDSISFTVKKTKFKYFLFLKGEREAITSLSVFRD
tara:strand:+ start:1812 stop:2147 length:336 start_codon:yes stop_codon:yes gene_type:complete